MNPHCPTRGVYHPVNHDLLLGGSGNIDNDGYMRRSTAVRKKFVSPVNDRGANKGYVLSTCLQWTLDTLTLRLECVAITSKLYLLMRTK